MMSFYLVRPCKSTAAYEAIPKNDLKLDLRKLEPELTRLGYNIEINAKVILVVTKDHNEISIYPKGKLMIKVDDQAVAEQIAEELEPILF